MINLECIEALEKVDFAIVRQRDRRIVLVRENPKNDDLVVSC